MLDARWHFVKIAESCQKAVGVGRNRPSGRLPAQRQKGSNLTQKVCRPDV